MKTYSDDFSYTLDFLTAAIPDSLIWEAYEVNAGVDATQDAVLTGLRTEEGKLIFESEAGNFEGAGLDDGVFLYRTVPGGIDFEAVLKVVGGDFTSFTGGTTLYHNSVGILVRSADYATQPDFIYAMMFELWGIHHMIKSIDDGVQTELFTGVSQLAQFPSFLEYPWIKLTRTGNVFSTATSADGITWFATNSVERTDFEGIDVRVGLTHCNFILVDETDPEVISIVPGVASAHVDDFSLTHEKVASVRDVNINGFKVWSQDRDVVIESSTNDMIQSSRIYSIDGRMIAAQDNINDLRCEFKNLGSGLYIVTAEISGSTQARKVVVR
jgi:hypothetical protein